MFGLGFWEVLLILAVALLVFGPARLPGLARSLGRGLREFRRASSDLQQAILSADTPDPAPTPRAGPADQAAQTPLPESPGTDSAAPQGAGQPPGSDG